MINNMKRLLSINLLLIIVLFLSACGNESTNNTSYTPSYSEPAQIQSEAANEEPNTTIPEPDTIVFGGYYEYKNGISDKSLEDITWYILAEEDDKLLLCSTEALFCSKYHSKTTDNVTWETSEIRNKLNDEFYNIAFTDAEKNRICSTTLEDTGTTDKVFLLSKEEADKYMSEQLKTNYPAREYITRMNLMPTYGDNNTCKWWLRTPGTDAGHFLYVSYNADYQNPQGTPNNTFGICPAIWIYK